VQSKLGLFAQMKWSFVINFDISVKATIYDLEKLKEENPTSVPLAWDIEVKNDMEYNMAYQWFSSDSKEDIFDFLTCCDFIKLNHLVKV
jgi:hypothetical protein